MKLTDDVLVSMLSIRENHSLVTMLKTCLREEGFVEELDDKARSHQILPLIRRELARFGLTDIMPDHYRREWAAVEERVLRRNLALLHAMEQLEQELSSRGLHVVLLEGVSLLLSTYGSVTARPLYDLELLIREEDTASAREIARLLGWGGCAREERHSHELPGREIFCRKERDLDLYLVLHGRLQWPLSMMDTRGTRERAVAKPYKDREYLHLKTEDMILFLALKWAVHLRDRESILWLIDFREILEKDVVFFDFLASRAKEWGLDLCLYLFVEEASRKFRTPPVQELMPDLAPRGVDRMMLRRAGESRGMLGLVAMKPWRIPFLSPSAVAAMQGGGRISPAGYVGAWSRAQWRLVVECLRWLAQ